jgi:PAS domain S-box-containing protein
MADTNFNPDMQSFLFRSNPVPMFVYESASLRILLVNDAALARYGYTSREFHSMTIRDLHPGGEAHALDPAQHAEHEASAQSLWTHCARNGKLFPVKIRLASFLRRSRKYCLMSVLDPSAFGDARAKLARSEKVHRALVRECPFGIYRLNLTTSRFEQVNPAFLRASGYNFEDLAAADVSSLFVDPVDHDRFHAELRAKQRVRDFETRFRMKDGGVIRVSVSGYLCTDEEPGHQYVHGYIRDLTRERELEELLSHTHRMETVGRLAGGVAHDFNNITQSISLSCELALRHRLSPPVESKLLDIMQQAKRAAEITRQLLAYSRRQVLQPRVVDLNETVRNALSILTRAVGVDVSIELKLDDTVDHILIDPEQLTLVLMHLADNARSAMPDGGPLQISTASCSAALVPGQDKGGRHCAMLTVTDSGVGMDEATRRRIFEPFFSTKDTTLTTGLGLSTVHGIISQSKGRILCESSPGQGATFRIYLPLATEPPVSAIAAIKGENNGCSILLSEDDPIVNKHLTHALKKAGFSVNSVCNGEEALAAFAAQPCEIVVTDIVMPKLGGIDLTKRLREQHPDVPVILISGYSEEISVLQHLPHNQIAYLQKPFASSQLVALIRGLFAHSTAEKPKLMS